ncbi:MAG: hypothetical protein MR555_06370, partial [Spirochaetia bacterium]|nr:hypothetical protein [Spirochaetia bacterium]
MKKRVLSFLVSMLTLALIGGGITGCNNDPDNTPSNPFAGKTFYGTVNGSYDVCKLDFTSDSKVTLTLYGKGEAGADVVEYLTYTVSDGIATVDYKGQKITTTKIENDTFKASLDGTEANTASFTTK